MTGKRKAIDVCANDVGVMYDDCYYDVLFPTLLLCMVTYSRCIVAYQRTRLPTRAHTPTAAYAHGVRDTRAVPAYCRPTYCLAHAAPALHAAALT